MAILHPVSEENVPFVSQKSGNAYELGPWDQGQYLWGYGSVSTMNLENLPFIRAQMVVKYTSARQLFGQRIIG